eukprot:5858291-Alexandrium_andersonii.AAC.1
MHLRHEYNAHVGVRLFRVPSEPLDLWMARPCPRGESATMMQRAPRLDPRCIRLRKHRLARCGKRP